MKQSRLYFKSYGFRKVSRSLQTGLLAVVATGIAIFLPFAPAQAEQQNTIRIGDDYDFIRMDQDAVWQDCRKLCREDDRCAAWTFVKKRKIKKRDVQLNLGGLKLELGKSRYKIINPQCRLKYATGEAHRNNCCVSGVKKIARHDHDHGHGRERREWRCVRYAEAAIEQYNQNLRQRCGLKGRHWHNNFNRHYNFCMDVRRARLRAVREERADELDECRVRMRRVRVRCNRYARAAVRDFEENKRLHCGFGESRFWGNSKIWHGDEVRHFQWCAKVKPARLERRAEHRAEDLSECRIEARKCDDFANRAVRHQRLNKRWRCGYEGPRWNASRHYHHERCMQMSDWRRKRDLRIRRKRIQACRHKH